MKVEKDYEDILRLFNKNKIDDVHSSLSEKIDAVAADVAAHRADTEIHRAGYGISEEKD